MTSNERSGDRRRLLFPIGALIFSEGVDRLMREGRLDPMSYFQRHIRGDWGRRDGCKVAGKQCRPDVR